MALRLRLASPNDAPALIASIKRCYGSSYLHPEALESADLAAELERGRLIYAMATLGSQLVGQVALERLHAQGLYHHCRAVVEPEWRGKGLLRSLSALLLGEGSLPEDARLVLGTSVTSHRYTQRYNLRAGFSPLGLLLGLHPEQTLSGLPTSGQAGSAVLMGLPTTTRWRLRCLALRGQALALANQVCRRLGIPYREADPEALSQDSLWTQWREGPGGLWHLRYGQSPESYGGPPADAALEWVDLPAEHASTPALLERWEGAGLSVAAYLPLGGPSGEDVIRLQRCRRPLDLTAIEVMEELRPLRDWLFGLHTKPAGALAR
jgi:GNAT superfamily N-acetyltransferase